MVETVTPFSRFWWLPTSIDHSVVDEDFFPRMTDLWVAGVWAVVLTVLRFVLRRFVFRPFARRFLPAKQRERIAYAESGGGQVKDRPALEALFQKSRRPKAAELAPAAKASSMSEEDARAWFKRRRAQWRSLELLGKVSEASWRCLYYASAVVLGLYVLHDKRWFSSTAACWDEYPQNRITDDIRMYYMVSLGIYFQFVFTQFTEPKRKDFWEMFIHHVATIGLITFSWWVNMTRVGSLIVLVHDIADPFLEAAKLCKYFGLDRGADALFAVFAIAFGVTRLYVFPRHLIWSASFESLEYIGTGWRSWYVFNGSLVLLLILHIIWFSIIARMVFKAIASGGVDKDARSETDSSEDEKEKAAREKDAASKKDD